MWTFLLEGEFWKAPRSKDGGVYRTAQAHIAFMLDRALAHHLISHESVVDGITIEMIARGSPATTWRASSRAPSPRERAGKPFNDA